MHPTHDYDPRYAPKWWGGLESSPNPARYRVNAHSDKILGWCELGANLMRTTPDWAAIEVAYRASRKPTREIARISGVTEAAIRKRAKKEGWERPEPEPELGRPKPALPPEREMTRVAVEPRADKAAIPDLIDKGRGLILALMAELEVENANIHMLAELVEIETAEDKGPHRRRILEKALSLPTRALAAKNLANALSTLSDAAPGKKQEREDKAKEVSTGRFATPAAPTLVVNNG